MILIIEHYSTLFVLFLNRAMNYGVIGFLIAKDVLHLLLPDSKRSSHLFCLGYVHS